MLNSEKGYVYAFTADDFHKLKQMAFARHFHSVAEAGRRDYDRLIEEYSKEPGVPRAEPRFVEMRALRVDDKSLLLNSKLKEHFPQYMMFFVVNRTVHEMFKRTEKFDFVGTVPATMMSDRPSEVLRADFWAFEQATNMHLWAE